MIGRIVRSVDFERVLGAPTRARSAHFALHFLASAPGASLPAAEASSEPGAGKLSTGSAPEEGKAVDETVLTRWLGVVVPKRHARRAVTRNLLKRQIRQAAAQTEAALHPGMWVVRLRSPFDRAQFTSAGSDALRDAAGRELRQLLADAARRGRGN